MGLMGKFRRGTDAQAEVRAAQQAVERARSRYQAQSQLCDDYAGRPARRMTPGETAERRDVHERSSTVREQAKRQLDLAIARLDEAKRNAAASSTQTNRRR